MATMIKFHFTIKVRRVGKGYQGTFSMFPFLIVEESSLLTLADNAKKSLIDYLVKLGIYDILSPITIIYI